MDDKHENHLSENAVSNVSADGTRPHKNGGIMNTLYPPGPKPGAGGRMKNHCRKFWWCDLLVVAVIVLVIVLPVVYVAIPKKAQNDLDKSTLEVTMQNVSSPKTDQVHLKLVTLAKSSSKFHPTLDGFRGALHLKDKEPFLYIDIPTVKADAETTITVDQDVKFADLGRFTEYNEVVISSESFDVYLDGKTKIHQKGLKAITADYNKVITMKGLNGLKGLNITDLKVLDKPNSDGSNMEGNVFIPNPSVMTLYLGNVTMNLAVDGKAIGTSLLPELTLKPGDNNVPMLSTVNQTTVIGLIYGKDAKYKNAILPLTITGNSSVVGKDHLTYYETAIKGNKVNVDLNVGPALASILG
ncbi:hypothetical protein GQ43DRAFT_36958 [Delitschia confertaspora ATCC 74209]|uniref:Uncharacterized protein n=1 Tax=Delitschia confertaspora ATCC 74209 TaxID=1513339 RepID=A0A9P4MSX0_9PLEO|nr:hypothetical protein GQ43DRAFT_36958 [Delitschia confertaspora ATCC 74209]